MIREGGRIGGNPRRQCVFTAVNKASLFLQYHIIHSRSRFVHSFRFVLSWLPYVWVFVLLLENMEFGIRDLGYRRISLLLLLFVVFSLFFLFLYSPRPLSPLDLVSWVRFYGEDILFFFHLFFFSPPASFCSCDGYIGLVRLGETWYLLFIFHPHIVYLSTHLPPNPPPPYTSTS